MAASKPRFTSILRPLLNAITNPPLLPAERLVHRRAQRGKRERLGQHIVDQRLEPVGALALVGIAGHQQDGHGGVIARRRERKRNAVHHRHADVGEQQVEATFLAHQRVERLGAVICGHDVMTVLLERATDQVADRLFVVCDQNACHLLFALRSILFPSRRRQGRGD